MQKKALNSLRVAYENWHDEIRFKKLLGLLGEYPCGINDVVLFTSAVHSPLTLCELERRTRIIKQRLAEVRAHGFRGGINILATIGHHCEDLENSLSGSYQHMTNIYGDECGGSYCMNDEAFVNEYVVPAYRLLAEAAPGCIWIDDDIRYGHMPIGMGCFCEGCIEKFNRENDTSFTRGSLRERLNASAGDTALRKKWLEHNSAAIVNLFTVIGKTVRAVSPDITLGFMTGERYFEGYDFAGYAQALSDNGRYDIMWRPGGGAYTDGSFDMFVQKAQEIGRQNAYLPDYVTVVQSEIENFPYQLIKKSPKSTASEAAMYFTSGCTGAAFNILPSETGEPIENCIPHLRAINKTVPFYELLQEKLHGLKPRGIHSGWRTDSQAAVPDGEWANMNGAMYASYSRELFDFGLPECFDEARADVFTLSGNGAAVMTDDEIIQILSGGVYLDAGALSYLNSRGFAELTGFTAGKNIPVDAREVYTDVPLNEGISGCIRNCRQAFNGGMSAELIPVFSECTSICRLEDYHGGILAGCSAGVFENSLGGRIAAAGYYPFSWISDAPKTRQLKRLFVYLSGCRLISFVDSYCRVRNVTLTGTDRICVTLFNTGTDTLEDTDVYIQTDKTTSHLYDMDCTHEVLAAKESAVFCGINYGKFTVKKIKPYEMVLIEL